MKKLLFFVLVFICFDVIASAQVLQRGSYNEGKILVYIEQRNDIYRRNDNKRADRLRLENISGSEITVSYCYKAVGIDANGFIFNEIMEYKTSVFKHGEKKSESGYMNANGYYVDSFAIMNVSVVQNNNTTPQNNNRNQQSITIPSWAHGTWAMSDDVSTEWITITATHFIIDRDHASTCERIDGDTLFFNSGKITVSRTGSSNQILVGILFDYGYEYWVLRK